MAAPEARARMSPGIPETVHPMRDVGTSLGAAAEPGRLAIQAHLIVLSLVAEDS